MIKKQSGSKQGQNDLPTLFAVYVNSLSECIKATGKGVKIGENWSVSLLLYADDIILLTENELDLCHKLCLINVPCIVLIPFLVGSIFLYNVVMER